MKTVLILLLTIGPVMNIWARNEVSDSTKTELVEAYLHYAFTEQYEKQGELMHPQIVDYHPTVLQNPARGRQELIKGWRETRESLSSASYEMSGIGELLITDGDMSGKWIVTTGILKTKFRGSDKQLRSHMVGFYKIEGGLIKEVRNYGNLLDIYLQMGYTLLPSRE